MKKNPLFLLFLLLFFPNMSIGAEIHTIEVEFSYTIQEDISKQLLGYRLYQEGEQVCETTDPSSSSITCNFLTEDGTFNFTLSAYYSDDSESLRSPSFPFTIVFDTPATSVPLQPVITPAETTDPVPPTAIVSSSTAVGNAPLKVTFNGTFSTTTDSSLVSYNWTFGDGSQATGKTTSHVFTTAGTYHTRLTVLDSNGLSDNVSTPIIVIGTAQANETPNASVSTNQTQEDETLTVSSDDVYILRDQPNLLLEDLPSLLSQTQVSQLYVSIFGRTSESEGNAYWQSEQSDMIAAANTMLNTEAAQNYFGSTLNNNQKFIEFIYENTLGKTYAEDPDGVNYWVNELANGKSKGQVIATLINAAMDPAYTGMLAQDQFINKVTVCNYVADTVATCPNVNDLCAFVSFISNVTYDSTTVVTAMAAVDAF